MDTRALNEIGLTSGEIKVYLALLRLGESTTGPLAKESQVSRSKLYFILDKLAKKGLVGHVLKGEVMYFKAMSAKAILNYMDEKSKEFNEQRKIVEEMVPKIDKQGKSRKDEAVLYEGFKSIKNFYLNILDELHRGDNYYVLGASYGSEDLGIREFFENYHNQRAKKGIKVRMLANHDFKDRMEESTFKNSEVRFLPQYLVTNMIIVFYTNKVFIFFLTDEPRGFLIESEEVAKSFRTYFDTFWKIAKK
jgi:sugar-specific transcriptional regulator TrmB